MHKLMTDILMVADASPTVLIASCPTESCHLENSSEGSQSVLFCSHTDKKKSFLVFIQIKTS